MKGHEEVSKGSALIVAAIVILIVGFTGLGLLYSLQSVTRETQEEQTAVKMHRVTHALSVYYQRYARIPCPADPDTADVNPPFGTERGSGVDGTAVGDCPLVAEEDGIVPFKTLGLSEDDSRDAWGRYFTYHVNQSSSWSAVEAAQYIAANPSVRVIDLCRVKNVWVILGGNYYPQQALACCMDPAALMQIKNSSGVDVTGLPSVALDRFAPLNAPALASSIHPPYTLPASPALVLISHGRNGMGAYLGTGTHARSPIGGTSAGEIANASGDTGNTVFVEMPRTESSSSSYYFDDIVMFKTFSSLYAEAGGNSGGGCSFAPGCPPVPEVLSPQHRGRDSDFYGNLCP